MSADSVWSLWRIASRAGPATMTKNRVAKKLGRNGAPAELKVTDELNRQRILNMLEIYYSGDLEGTLARCTDDVEFFSNAPVDILPHLGAHRGKAEVRAMWETIYLRYSEMRHEVPIIVAEGDKVAVLIRLFLRKRNNNR